MFHHRRRMVALLCCVAALAVGVFVLVGWAAKIETLTTPFGATSPMKPNTAVAGILLALATLPRRGAVADRGSRLSASLTVLLAGATLLQDLARLDLGIDQLVFADNSHFGPPGRM
ncbi:MAG TPA: hypothetical protein VD978_24065, partial [Azospirillum sp.]|nr:hypothetical protein [Azospirillum sp.]